uniref:Putative major capsid protein n=1 Tax=viral metagenome TaxID=1070528 RepID=A0A6M3JYU2_9ZZZZ
MADWTFTTANALARQSWAKRWWIVAKTESYFYGMGFIGKASNATTQNPNAIVTEFMDLKNQPGYQHTYGQIRELSNAGIQGDADMEGNEEAPSTYDDQITIDLWRNAIRTKGKLSEQYKSDEDTRLWAMELLKRWMATKIDQSLFDAAGTALTKVLYGGTATTTATIAAGDYFVLALIAKAVAYSRKATPKIIGPRLGGRQLNGVCVISPDQEYDLQQRDGEWAQAQREAMRPGLDNPIFTGASGMKNMVPIHTHERVAVSTTWGSSGAITGATALFMGVGALAIAYFLEKIWEEKTFDYGNKVGFCIGSGYGCSKTVFNGADNAIVGIRTSRTNN